MTITLKTSAALVAVLALAACNKPASQSASDASQTAGATANKAEDSTGAAVGATSASTVGTVDTGAFVSNASQSDMYEVQAARIAQKRSTNAEVKAFAKAMETAHTKMSADMKLLVQAAGQTPAAGLDHRRSGFIDHLNQASEADFDKTYIDQQVAAHKEALDLMQGYADHGSDAGLKGGAQTAVPMVRAHLSKAQDIQAKLAGAKP